MKFQNVPQSECKKSAFTLIELLVVIAIISLLAAILFPVFGRARENARRSSCMSNMKQMGLGILQYSQDFDERMVPVGGNNNNNMAGCTKTTQPAAWSQRIFPYVKSLEVYRCPSNTSKDSVAFASADCSPEIPYPAIRRSYALNQRFSYPEAMPLSYLQEPARKIMAGESAQNPGWQSFTTYAQVGWDPDDYVSNGFAGHLSTANYLFADGHVKSMRPLSTATPFNMWGGVNTRSGYTSVCSGTNFRNINCDAPEPLMKEGMAQLEALYQ